MPTTLVLGAIALGIISSWISVYIVLGIFVVITIYLSLRQPHILIWMLAAYTVFEETLLRWLPGEFRYFGEIGIITLLVVTLAKQPMLSGKLHFRRTPLDVPLAIFMIVAMVSIWTNEVPAVVGLLGLRPWLRYVALFYLVTLLNWPEKTQRRFVLSLMLLAAAEASIGLFQAVGGARVASWFAAPSVIVGDTIVQQIMPGLIGAKIFGTLARYDRFGNYLMLMFLLAISLIPSLSKRKRSYVTIASLIIAMGLALSFSRQAWLGAAAGLLLVAILNKRTGLRLIILLVLLLVPLVFLLAEPPSISTSGGNPATMITRFLEPFSDNYWQSLNNVGGRMYYIFDVGPKLLDASPLFGLGPGRFASLVTRIYPTTVYTDLDIPLYFSNYFALDIQWMAMLGQVGLFGLLAFLWMLFRLGKLAFIQYKVLPKNTFRRQLALAFLAWSIAIAVVTWLGPNLEVRSISFFYWLIAGIVVVNQDQIAATKLKLLLPPKAVITET